MAHHWLQEKRPYTATARENIPSIVFDDTESLSSEDGSLASTGASSKKRSRPRTLYGLCYPPPKNGTRQKNQRPLLQLHKITQSSRPRPTFDIVPATRLSGTLCNEFTKPFSTKPVLNGEDLAIVKAGEYLENGNAGADQEHSAHILAVVLKGRKGDKSSTSNGKLLLHDGTEWTASPFGSSGYEFVCTDQGETKKIRWFSKRPQGRRTDSAAESLRSIDQESQKLADAGLATPDEAQAIFAQKTAKTFSCSSISPNTRRHPIVARLTSSSIDIPDTYNIPAPSSGSDVQEPQKLSGSQDMTPALRTLITATAIYVSLHEGWCPDFRPTQAGRKTSDPITTVRTSRTATLSEPLDKNKVGGARKKSNSFLRFFNRKGKDESEQQQQQPKPDGLKKVRSSTDNRPKTSAN